MKHTKRYAQSLTCILLAFILLFTFSGCDVFTATLTITAEYSGGNVFQNEQIDKSKLKVTATYYDGLMAYADIYEVDDYVLSGLDSSVLGPQTVTVTYVEDGLTAKTTFNVNVVAKPVPKPVGITATYVGDDLYVGDGVDKNDFDVTITFDDDSKVTTTDFSAEIVDGNNDGQALAKVSIVWNATDGTVTNLSTMVLINLQSRPVGITATYTGAQLFVGDVLDKTQFDVTVTYDNNVKQTADDFSVSDVDTTSSGEKQVTISYFYLENSTSSVVKELQTTITLVVNPIPVVFEQLVVNYVGSLLQTGDILDKTQFDVVATFSDGSSSKITDYVVSDVDTTTAGDKTVTISCLVEGQTYSATTTVTVINAEIQLSQIQATFNNTQFRVGHTLTTSDFDVIATYSDGATATITDFDISQTTFDEAGNHIVTLTHTHKGVTKTFTLTIVVLQAEPEVESITATFLLTTFRVGQTLTTSNFNVVATYSDGTTARVTDIQLSQTTFDQQGSHTVTISHTHRQTTKTCEVTINVLPPEATLSAIDATLLLTEFRITQTLSEADFVVTATFSDGKTTTVSGFEISQTTFTQTGAQIVTISYTYKGDTKTCNVTIDVLPPEATLVGISANFLLEEFSIEDSLTKSDFVVTATLSDGVTNTVSDFQISLTSFQNTGANDVTISYTYKGVTKTCVVTINVLPKAQQDLSIHLMDLGNSSGDSIYIKAGETDILIDAGTTTGSLAKTVPYIKKHCTDNVLEYVIVTHADSDHIAGFSNSSSRKNMFEEFECKTIIDFPKTGKDTAMYKEYVANRDNEVATTEGAVHYTALQCVNQTDGAQKVYDLTGDGAITMEILYQKYYEQSTSNENNYSVCLLITQQTPNGEAYYLFTGDLEGAGEKSLVQNNPDLPEVLFYKAGHHGSETGSSMDLLNVIKPQYVGISCAVEDKYDFPHQTPINNIANFTDKVYVTMGDGSNYTMNGNLVFSNVDGVFTVTGSNNSLTLKQTTWFKEQRTCPAQWA